MENVILTPMLVWFVKILSLTVFLLTIYATVNIFQSIWFNFWSSRHMNDRQKREFYIKKRYDVKWSLSFTVMSLLGFVHYQIVGFKDLSWWYLLCAFLFLILFWGNYRTLNILKDHLRMESERLEKRKIFNLDS